MAYQAFLQQVLEKDTKAGKMYDLQFSDGNKVGAGKFPPKNLTPGEFYEYDFSMNGNFKNLTSGSVKQLAKPAGVSAPAAAAPARSFGKSDAVQGVIQRQSACNTAVAFVDILAKTDSLPMPAKAPAAKRADLMEQILKEYITKFHMWNTHEEFDFGAEEAKASGDLDLADLEDKEEWTE